MTVSVLSGLKPEQIKYEPYPHLVVENALDPEYFAQLDAAFPGMERIAGSGTLENNTYYYLAAREVLADTDLPAIWREFFAYHTSSDFLQEFLEFWQVAIDREYPDLKARFGKPLSELTTDLRRGRVAKQSEHLASDFMLECNFGINSPVSTPSSVRGPHLDRKYKLFNSLVYFRSPEDDTPGGDLELYRLKTRFPHYDEQSHISMRSVERFTEVPYRSNTLVMWLNTPASLHGVTPRGLTDIPRRYVNLFAESFVLKPGGFFRVPRSLTGRAMDAARRRFRDA